MNYKRIYEDLVLRGKQREVEGYIENHHIVPKCMGGTDDTDNLVKLTAREHFIAHVLLCKIYPNSAKLLFAFNCMCNRWGKNRNAKRDYVIKKSCVYERLKVEMREKLRERMSGENNPRYGKPASNRGVPASEETRRKLSERFSGEKNPMYGKKRPKYIGEAVAKANRERVWTEEARAKTGTRGKDNHMFGKHLSKEAKSKRRMNLCGEILEQYGCREIDPSLWDDMARKTQRYPRVITMSLGTIIKNYGSFEGMLDCYNKRFGTDYVAIYPDFYTCLLQCVRIDKQRDSKLNEFFGTLKIMLPILRDLYGESENEISEFISFIFDGIENVRSRLNLSDTLWGGNSKNCCSLDKMWLYES